TYAIRPLVVISIVDQVKANPNYALQVAVIEAWEKKHGRIPEGSVVFARSSQVRAGAVAPHRSRHVEFMGMRATGEA
ncbi:cyclase family protein, partial [Methyloceanibacter sp.]|uniref:cyclase family protein n=1 Tax=Methyloceanibacter sp. TaxID=1965321 RepID=UPI003C78CD1E